MSWKRRKGRQRVCASCGHIWTLHRKESTGISCFGPTSTAFGAVGFGCTCKEFKSE